MGGLDLGVSEALHDRPEICTSGQQPGGVRVAQVVQADAGLEPGAVTAGRHTRVRKVLRDIGWRGLR